MFSYYAFWLQRQFIVFKCHYIVFVYNLFQLNDTSSFDLKSCGFPDAIIYFRLALYDVPIHEVFLYFGILSFRRAA